MTMNINNGLPLVTPRHQPVLDPGFRPAALTNANFRRRVCHADEQTIAVALERDNGRVARFDTAVFPDDHPDSTGNFTYLERWLKFLLWSRGGCRIHVAGSAQLANQLQRHFAESATGHFDATLMGDKVYGSPFTVVPCAIDDLPCEAETRVPLGRHLDGCRIGFDLGASDRKVAAVIDGNTVFSEEIPWDPRVQTDPQWHFNQIMMVLRRAAEKMPRVDAIGGSSAGIYVDNVVKAASLFRGVPDALFHDQVSHIFLDLQTAWNNVPFDVVNDGEVTALAGSMAIGDNGVLGVAMGSSEAVGYVDMDGNITSWLNELAFAPVDYSPNAAVDEWSGDYGCGVQYFSQQAVGRLIPASGLDIDTTQPLPEQLIAVQERMSVGDERAAHIYSTIGTYFGYTIAHYAEFYDFNYLLVLGRVTSGPGGEQILKTARMVMDDEFPTLSERVRFHVPDETEKRHGQAMAAASLPARQPV